MVYISQMRYNYEVEFGKKVVILHGFIKKTPKTPLRDLSIAKKRLSEVKDGK